MRLPSLLIAAIGSLLASMSSAQSPGTPPSTGPAAILQVDADRPVGARTAYPLVEPHLSVAPTDPRRLLAGAMALLAPNLGSIDCEVLASRDGGGTWTASRVGEHGPTGCGDIWTAMLPNGVALASYGGDSSTVIRQSGDGGRTWQQAVARIPGSLDHTMLAVDTTRHRVYLVGAGYRRDPGRPSRPAIHVLSSVDDGRTFAERSRTVLTNVAQEAITPVVLEDGTLVIGTIDHHDASGRLLERRRAWVVHSRDAGATFSEPLLVTESCSKTRPTAWPSLAVAPKRDSAPERLFFTCEAEGNHGILFARSSDRGERWTAARRIDGGSDSTWTKTPTMATSTGGLLAVTWADARNDTTGRCFHLYGTVSLDGGATFLPPRQLSSAPSCPTATGIGEGVPARFPSGGEYHGLVGVGPNEFMAVWPDARDGEFQLRSVRFRVITR